MTPYLYALLGPFHPHWLLQSLTVWLALVVLVLFSIRLGLRERQVKGSNTFLVMALIGWVLIGLVPLFAP